MCIFFFCVLLYSKTIHIKSTIALILQDVCLSTDEGCWSLHDNQWKYAASIGGRGFTSKIQTSPENHHDVSPRYWPPDHHQRGNCCVIWMILCLISNEKWSAIVILNTHWFIFSFIYCDMVHFIVILDIVLHVSWKLEMTWNLYDLILIFWSEGIVVLNCRCSLNMY